MIVLNSHILFAIAAVSLVGGFVAAKPYGEYVGGCSVNKWKALFGCLASFVLLFIALISCMFAILAP